MDKVQEKLTKGQDQIADRQRKIKMADRSDYSWGMVEAYERDELADNSADEKRMEKAEKEAERTAGEEEENVAKRPVFGQRGAGAEKAVLLGAFKKNRWLS